MGELSRLSIIEAKKGLTNKEFSSKELTLDCINEAKNSNKLNAFCEITEKKALSQALEADKLIQKKEGLNLLGIPLGIKDIFCTNGVKTQAASKILENFVPYYESTVTENLWKNGAVMLGKLNMDEFAMGSSNITSIYGPVVNPWRKENSSEKLSPGGSSGGSAAAVAADLCIASIGTDTGGSIRQPASFNGIVGLKPTYGRCSRWGIIAFASSLDQAGPMTKNVKDSAILLSSMASYDKKDSTSAKQKNSNFLKDIDNKIKGKKIGIPKEYRIKGLSQEIEKCWDIGIKILKENGAEIIDISLPHTKYALPAYYVIAPAEASSNLSRYDGVKYGYRSQINPEEDLTTMYERTRKEGFGEEVKRRVLIGTFVLSSGFYDAYYLKALKIRRLIYNDFQAAFNEGVDAILTPTAPSSAFSLNSNIKKDPIEMYLNDIFTVPVNLAGLPAISIPAILDNSGLPTSLQLIGKPWREDEICNFANILEKELNFVNKPEKWWE